jgi:hypothetical protein
MIETFAPAPEELALEVVELLGENQDLLTQFPVLSFQLISSGHAEDISWSADEGKR